MFFCSKLWVFPRKFTNGSPVFRDHFLKENHLNQPLIFRGFILVIGVELTLLHRPYLCESHELWPVDHQSWRPSKGITAGPASIAMALELFGLLWGQLQASQRSLEFSKFTMLLFFFKWKSKFLRRVDSH